MNSLVRGIGINDADYVVTGRINGVHQVTCPFYSKWASMITRCYCKTNRLRQPTYESVGVCEEWLTFSNFKRWMESNDWLGRDLDKDLLGNGDLYSPESCCFLLPKTNRFIQNYKNRPMGVTKGSKKNPYKAQSRCTFTGKAVHLGRFKTEEDAVLAYTSYRKSLAVKIAETETDQRVKRYLLSMYGDDYYETTKQ